MVRGQSETSARATLDPPSRGGNGKPSVTVAAAGDKGNFAAEIIGHGRFPSGYEIWVLHQRDRIVRRIAEYFTLCF